MGCFASRSTKGSLGYDTPHGQWSHTGGLRFGIFNLSTVIAEVHKQSMQLWI